MAGDPASGRQGGGPPSEEADEANRWPWNTAAGRTKHAMAASVPPQMQHMQLQQVPPAQPHDVQLPQAFQDLTRRRPGQKQLVDVLLQ